MRTNCTWAENNHRLLQSDYGFMTKSSLCARTAVLTGVVGMPEEPQEQLPEEN